MSETGVGPALISVSGSPCDLRPLLSGAENTTWFRASNVYFHRTEEEKVQEYSLPVKSVNHLVSLLSYPVNGGCASTSFLVSHCHPSPSAIHQLCTSVCSPALSPGEATALRANFNSQVKTLTLKVKKSLTRYVTSSSTRA